MLSLQGMLFMLALAGFYARKRGIIPPKARSYLSDLLIDLILPMNIISSFDIELKGEVLVKAGVVLLLSLGVQLMSLLLGRLLYAGGEPSRRSVLRYSTLVSNAGFMGLPIVRAALGTEAGLYASVALIPLRVFMWSAGLSQFTATDFKATVRSLVTHPCNIAVAVGFLTMLLPGGLPDFLSSAVSSIGNCATAVSMLIIGGFLAETDIRTVFTRDTLLYSGLRLLAIPLLVFAFCFLLGADRLLTGVVVLLSAMPAGSTTAILAAKYDGDAPFASRIIFVSTLLSLFTIPLFTLLAV